MFEPTPGYDLHDLKTLYINSFSVMENKGRIFFSRVEKKWRKYRVQKNNFPRKSFTLSTYFLNLIHINSSTHVL